MDNLDRKLIELLKRNSREAVSNLAHHIGTTRATVKARIQKLKEKGIIEGFTILLGNHPSETRVEALTFIKIEKLDKKPIKRKLFNLPEIETVHNTNGQWDIIIRISAPSLTRLDQILTEIRMINGIIGSETHLLLTTERYQP